MHLWALDAILLAYTIYISSNRIEGRDLLRIIWTRSLTFRFLPLICFCIANRYFIIVLLLLFATIRTPSTGRASHLQMSEDGLQMVMWIVANEAPIDEGV